MLPKPWILMLIEGGAIEPGKTVCIFGKVRGNPVEDDANPMLVAVVDKPAEIFRGAKAAGGREIWVKPRGFTYSTKACAR